MELISSLISLLLLSLLIAMALYIWGLMKMPVQRRARTPKFNRFGEVVGERENPDFHVNPGEAHEDNPDLTPLSGRRGEKPAGSGGERPPGRT